MNLPNKLTLGRIVLIIPFIIFLKLGNVIQDKKMMFDILALIIFAFASITDFLDGYLARKHNLITDFGKLMDPLADKILVMAALILFVEFGFVPSWMLIVIVSREFMITGIRVIAAAKGDVIAAGKLGKYKTAAQMIAICIIIFTGKSIYSTLLMLPPVALTVWSGGEYVLNAKKYFLDS